MTAEEYLALGETRERYELIDGVVVRSPSPTPRHQRVAFLIALQVESHAEQNTDVRMIPGVDVRVARSRVYRPHIVVYARGRAGELPELLTSAPDLVVEVLSPGSERKDLVTKRADYEAFGVSEYWVVEPDALTVRQWVRSEGKFQEASGVST